VAVPVAVAAEPPLAPVVVMERGAGAGDSSEAEGELFGAEVSPAKAVAELAACRVTTGTTSTRRRRRRASTRRSSAGRRRRRTSGGRRAEAGRGGGCFGGDFGARRRDARAARAAQWQRDNPDLLLRGRPPRVLPQPLGRPGLRRGEGGAAGARALQDSPDYRHECGICDRDYMLPACCAAGARAVGTRRGDRMGLVVG